MTHCGLDLSFNLISDYILTLTFQKTEFSSPNLSFNQHLPVPPDLSSVAPIPVTSLCLGYRPASKNNPGFFLSHHTAEQLCVVG